MAAPFILQQSLIFQLQGQKTSNVIHWKNVDAVDDGDLLDEYAAIQATMWAAYRQVIHSAVEFLGSVFSKPLDPTYGTRSFPVVGFVGDLSGDVGPTTRYYIIRRYGNPDGKRKRGRCLVGGFPEQWSEKNVLTDAAALATGPLVDQLKDTISAPNSDWTPEVYSRLDEDSTTVFKTTLDPIVRSYHGRQATGL